MRQGMKHRIHSFHIPPGHRYTVIALQNGTKYCLEFTATGVVECFLRCLVSSALPRCRLATYYLDNLRRFDEPSH